MYHKFSPALQRASIMAILTKSEGRVLLADEIVKVFKHRFTRAVAYKRLNDLERKGWVERVWYWDMPNPRFGISSAANVHLKKLLRQIIHDAGVEGITEADADEKLVQAVLDDALNLEETA